MQKTTLAHREPITDDFVMERISDSDEVQLNFVRVRPGKSLPAHNANSNVHLLALEGELTVVVFSGEIKLQAREITPVAFGTHMQINNTGDAEAAFLVIKTPNPRLMG